MHRSLRSKSSLPLLLLLLLLILPAGRARAAGGERQLGPAAVYLLVRLQSGYDALAEVRKLLPKRMQAMMPLVSASLTRDLGFDALSAAWMDSSGIDSTVPAWASLFSFEPAALRARLGRVEQAAKRHLASSSRSSYFKAADVAGGLAWIRHRIVVKLRDEAKAKNFLSGIGSNTGSRAVLLQGKTKAAVAPALASALGLTAAQSESLAEGLLGRGVLLVSKIDRNMLALYRIVEGSAIVDLVSEAIGFPEKPGDELKAGLLLALTLPKRSGLDLKAKGLGRRVFADDAAVAALVAPRPFLTIVSETETTAALRLSWFGTTPESFAKRMKEVQACRKSFAPGSVPVGELGAQLRGDGKGLHARVSWAAPAAVTRALQAAASKRDLVDVTEWRSKVVALAGLGVELGPVLKALPRSGPFKLSTKAFDERVRACPDLANVTILLGGWVGLLAQLKAEAKDNEAETLLLEHARNAVVLMRDFSVPTRPNLIAQVSVAPAGAAKLKESVGKLAPEYGRPETKTMRGHPTTIYPYLKAPLWGYSLGVTDLKKDGLMLTLASSRWELPSFLEQSPPTSRVLPARILAFAHGQLPKLLVALQADPNFRLIGKLLRDTAKRVGDLGANLTISDGALVAEIRIGLKPP